MYDLIRIRLAAFSIYGDGGVDINYKKPMKTKNLVMQSTLRESDGCLAAQVFAS